MADDAGSGPAGRPAGAGRGSRKDSGKTCRADFIPLRGLLTMEKPRILLVDDREENLLALERILAGIDAETVRASNGNDALKSCLNQDFALALLDVNMPDMDGYELAELMRG